MDEIVPGIWHWSARHPRIRIVVHSYYLPQERAVIDPIAPPCGLDFFAEHGAPTDVLLTNRHHFRDSDSFADRFGATVRCSARGLHEFTHGERVEPFEVGDVLAGGIVVHEVGAICPDECALHIPTRRALAIADGAVRWKPGGPLAFVPDHLMDEPAQTKEGLRAAYRVLADDLEFDHLLLAHGEPFVGDGRDVLRVFAADH